MNVSFGWEICLILHGLGACLLLDFLPSFECYLFTIEERLRAAIQINLVSEPKPGWNMFKGVFVVHCGE